MIVLLVLINKIFLMKTLISFSVIAIFFIATSATPIKQPTQSTLSQSKFADEFTLLRAHHQGKGASITWAFSSANAGGFIIERTYEDPTDPYSVWETVANVDAGAGTAHSYKYIDESVFPGFVNYRITACMNLGYTVMSQVATVHIVSHH
jgi:hypothetical protein